MRNLRLILHLTLVTLMVILLSSQYSAAQNSFPTPTGPAELDQTGAGAGSGGELRLFELNATGNNFVGWKAPDNIAANVVWVLPNSDGGSGNVLSTDGSGNLSFVKRVNTDLSNLKNTGTAVNVSLLPGVDNSIDLGSVTFSWRDLHLDGSLFLDGFKMLTNGNSNTNTFVGISAGAVNTGGENTFVGNIAGQSNTTGANNTFVGQQAGGSNTTGGDNTCLGENSGTGITTGTNITCVGQGSNASPGTITNAVAIGADVSVGASNSVAIGDGSPNYNVGINTSTPEFALHILGGTDTEIASGGFMVIGATTGENISFDNNEIEARNNGVAGTLFLQNDGGDVNVSDGALRVTGSTNVVNTLTNMVVGGTLDVAGATVSFGSIESISDGGADLIVSSSTFATDADGVNSLGSSANTWFDVWATDVTINSSDARLKENIADIKYGLPEIMEMHPVSYTWIQHPDAGTKLGLLAQEMQSVLPEVVRDWEYVTDEQTGKQVKTPSVKLGIQYDAIIPVLIKGMQDQQNQIAEKDGKIAAQQTQIQQLADRVAALESRTNSTDGTARFSINTENAQPVLGQNIPNPFDNSTLIPFRLPKNCKDASLRITETTTGRILRVIPLVCGETQVSIDAGQLTSGNYTYSLYVDGNLIDTKQMTLTK